MKSQVTHPTLEILGGYNQWIIGFAWGIDKAPLLNLLDISMVPKVAHTSLAIFII